MSVICITLGGWACGSVPPKHRPPNLSCGTSAVALTAPSLSVTGMKPSGSVMTEGTLADCRERARHEGRGGGGSEDAERAARAFNQTSRNLPALSGSLARCAVLSVV